MPLILVSVLGNTSAFIWNSYICGVMITTYSYQNCSMTTSFCRHFLVYYSLTTITRASPFRRKANAIDFYHNNTLINDEGVYDFMIGLFTCSPVYSV